MYNTRFLIISAIILSLAWLQGCSTLGFGVRIKTVDTVELPYVKNSANECYYLDEFMPVPDSMVTGKSGRLSLRYYTYNAANYKDWDEKQIMLAFYSENDSCWSLFEEYYLDN